MITLESNFVCDGASVLRATRPDLRRHDCNDIFTSEPYAEHHARTRAALECERAGWLFLFWRGSVRHLCPWCAGRYSHPPSPTPLSPIHRRPPR